MISRRKFITSLAGASVCGAFADVLSSDTPFPDACKVRTARIAAPAGWSGKTALFVTDIHFSNYFGPQEAEALNAIVRREKPDLVLMGGDLAHTPETDLTDFFTQWSPGCPTLFAPGNHDIARHMSGQVLWQAQEGGMNVLCNATETWNDITFVGFPSALQAGQRQSLLDAPGLKIVLGHEPDVWDWYTQDNLLHLAGHTHGGQIRICGWPLCRPTLGKNYTEGVFTKDRNSTLIVSAGIGCVDVRARIDCPPEIIKLEFV